MTDEELEQKLAALVESHIQKMDGIATDGIRRSQELMEESLASIKKRTGIKNAMLDSALESLGVSVPT